MQRMRTRKSVAQLFLPAIALSALLACPACLTTAEKKSHEDAIAVATAKVANTADSTPERAAAEAELKAAIAAYADAKAKKVDDTVTKIAVNVKTATDVASPWVGALYPGATVILTLIGGLAQAVANRKQKGGE